MPPRFVSCPLCGQGFGSASVQIHIPQCHAKMVKRWENLPTKDRGPRPVLPGRAKPSSSDHHPMKPSTDDRRSVGSRESAGPARRPGAPTAKPVYDLGPPNVELGGLVPCRKCGRKFTFDRVQVHQRVCIADRGRRKQFDSTRQRLRGTDAEPVGGYGRSYKRGGGRTTSTAPASRSSGYRPKTNWRQQHNDFIAAIRSARQHAVARPAQRAYETTSRSMQRATGGANAGITVAISSAPRHSSRGGRPDSTASSRYSGSGGGVFAGGGGGGGGFMADALPPRQSLRVAGDMPRMRRQSQQSQHMSPSRNSAFGGGPADRFADSPGRSPGYPGSGGIASTNRTSAEMRAIFGQ